MFNPTYKINIIFLEKIKIKIKVYIDNKKQNKTKLIYYCLFFYSHN